MRNWYHVPVNPAIKLTIAAGLFFAVWKVVPLLLFPSTSLHYKLSVDVDDNGVLHHGEGVIAVSYQSQGPVRTAETPNWSAGANGEAFAVDLGAKGALFVLLASDPARYRKDWSKARQGSASPEAGRQAIEEYFGFSTPEYSNDRSALAVIDDFIRRKPKVSVPAIRLPMLVRFADVNDPKTVQLVDPAHMEASFGPGVSILRASAEVTDEAVTRGIETKLPWIKSRSIMDNPGWSQMPFFSKTVINGLFTGTLEGHFK